jgi:beta-xylosidase
MKNILFIVLLTTFVLSACGTPAITPSPIPTNTQIPSATAIPSKTPSPTITLTPTITFTPTFTLTPTITPTPYPIVFRDDFEGSLDRRWIWVRENKQTWNLTSNTGWLEILPSSGFITSEDVENLLVRKAPRGNFGIETKLKFRPISNFQYAHLLIYQSPGDSIQFGRNCVGLPNPGDGFYFDLSVNWENNPENFAVAAPTTDTVYLRLLREGNTYTAYTSEDGTIWILIGAHTSEMMPTVVGLVVGGLYSSTTPQPAQFDYFVIFSLP